MHRTFKLVAAASVVMAAFTVQAADFYVGGSIGGSRWKVDEQPGLTIDKSDTGGKIFAGVALNEMFSVEVGYATLGKAGVTDAFVSGDVEANLLTEPSAFPAVIGALLPIAVWAREERFGPGFIWTLPVDRMRHALIKVLAGWIWLMGGVVLYALSLLVLGSVWFATHPALGLPNSPRKAVCASAPCSVGRSRRCAG